MTTPETPGESPELHDGDPSSVSSTPPDPSAVPSSRRGFNWRSKWVFIGGSVAAVVAVVVVAAVVVMLTVGGGSGGSSSALELIPDNTEVLFILNVETIRSREADFPGDYYDFADEIQEEIDTEFDTEEISLEQVNGFVLVIDTEYYDDILLLVGEFAFGDIRDEWEDQGFEEDSYIGYEIWDGDNYYALLEEDGAIIASYSEEHVKEVVKIVDRGSGSLAADQDGDLTRIMARLGSSPVMIGVVGDSAESCDAVAPGCVGYGAAYSGSDLDREEVTANLVFLFSSERRAERAVDEYDDVADLMEQVLENFAEEADDFSGLPDVDGVDIDDITADGEFVLGVGIVEIDVE